MTEIQIISAKRNTTGYIEVSYKMSFVLPAIYGTGASPIEGLNKILSSFPDGFSSEVVPVAGTVITLSETKSQDLSVTLAQAKTFLQNRYAAIRAQLDGQTLSPLDNLSGLSWDGTTWATSAAITDFPVTTSGQSNLSISATGVTGAGVTATLAAVAGKFHNITFIEITAYSTAARTGGATPVIVTTTNINSNPAFTFATAAAIGTTDLRIVDQPQQIKSAVANTTTTIVCPATTGIIWRVNVFYNVSI